MAEFSDQSGYDVFLNYGGEVTRTTFVDPLFAALVQNGIRTFKDDDDEKSLPSWNEIQVSRFAIVVLSKSYASSSCLDELVKIMECSRTIGQLVLPVYYYDFDPSSLRRQGLVFGELFAKYEMEKVRAWTSALVEAANLSGLGLINDRCQAKHIKEIVEMVLNKLNINNLNQNAMGNTASTLQQLLTGAERHEQQPLQVETRELTKVKAASNPARASSSPRSSWWTCDVFTCFKGNETWKDI